MLTHVNFQEKNKSFDKLGMQIPSYISYIHAKGSFVFSDFIWYLFLFYYSSQYQECLSSENSCPSGSLYLLSPLSQTLLQPWINEALVFPSSQFLRNVLSFYEIEDVNLVQYSILFMSTFIHLCEAFNGAGTSLNIFHHFDHLRKTNVHSKKLASDCGLRLQPGIRAILSKYVGLPDAKWISGLWPKEM
jgi:hypothetical protein